MTLPVAFPLLALAAESSFNSPFRFLFVQAVFGLPIHP